MSETQANYHHVGAVLPVCQFCAKASPPDEHECLQFDPTKVACQNFSPDPLRMSPDPLRAEQESHSITQTQLAQVRERAGKMATERLQDLVNQIHQLQISAGYLGHLAEQAVAPATMAGVQERKGRIEHEIEEAQVYLRRAQDALSMWATAVQIGQEGQGE